jgi:cytochrome c-type biogenesis protein CcmH/NrfG
MVSFRKLLAFILLASALAFAQPAEDLLASGRVDEAIAALQAKIKTSPKDAASYNLLCRAYFALGDWNRGSSACERAVDLEPNNSLFHLWLGRIYGEKADAANFLSAAMLAGKVRREFETAVQLSPDSVAARTDLAEFYLEAPGIVGGGKDKALAQAKTLATLDPAKAHWVKARIAQKNHDDADAEKEYKASVEASHGSANAWLNLASFYWRTKRLDEMENALDHAASAQSKQPEILMEAAEILIRTGRDFPGAIRMLRQYLSNSTVEAAPAFKAHYLLGTALEKVGDKQEAAQEYRASLAMASSFSRARKALDQLNR